MPKAPAKKPTRRPPEPVDDHAVIADWMEQAMPALQPILAYLDRTIRPPLGEGSRYVKIRSLDEARAPEVRDWIGQATKHPGWR